MKPFDEHGAFVAAAEGQGLRRLALRGAGVTMLSQTATFAMQMLGMVVLARLLTPADFGLMAMVTTVSLLLMNVGLNGFTEAMLQREEMTHSLASNVFWINTGVGLALTVLFASASPLLAWAYGEPRVTAVAGAVAVTILFTSISVPHQALLMRAMRFSEISATGLLSRAAAVVLSIVLAWIGFGYWALVTGAVVFPFLTTTGTWMLCRWVPGLPRRGVGTRSMVRFAMNTYGSFAVGYLTRNIDVLLLGWRFGPEAVGFYKKAYDLFVLPIEVSAPVTRVAVPALSRVSTDAARRGRCFVDLLGTVAFVGMGLGVGLALIGDEVILLVLGPRWTESGRIFTVLASATGFILLYFVSGWIHLAIGRADRLFRSTVTALVVTSTLFVVAVRWGPVGLAVACVTSLTVFTVPALWYAASPAGVGVGAIVAAVWKFVAAAALAGGVTLAISPSVASLTDAASPVGAVGRIAVVGLAFGALYVGAVVLLHRGCDPIRHIAALVGDMGVPGPLEALFKRRGRPNAEAARRAVAASTEPAVAAERNAAGPLLRVDARRRARRRAG